jgi:hypothetical protein
VGRRRAQAVTPTPEHPEPADAMEARVRASLERQGMMATLGGAERPIAVMQATMTALYDRPDLSG